MKKILILLIAFSFGALNTLEASSPLPKIKQSDQMEKVSPVLDVAEFVSIAQVSSVAPVVILETPETMLIRFESKRRPINLIYSVRRAVWPGYNFTNRSNKLNQFKILHLDPGLSV